MYMYNFIHNPLFSPFHSSPLIHPPLFLPSLSPPLGADQDHKTDEMHTALMEACMDGHVEVARLLLDHGAQVNTHTTALHCQSCS